MVNLLKPEKNSDKIYEASRRITQIQNDTFFYKPANWCTSSSLSEDVSGDILISDKEFKQYENHTKLTVQLQILQVKQHISQFDFEEDYKEI